jgi:hypothetical protein
LRSNRSAGSTGEEDIVFIYLNGKGSKPEAAEVVAAFVPTRPKISESYIDLIIQLVGSHASGSPEID